MNNRHLVSMAVMMAGIGLIFTGCRLLPGSAPVFTRAGVGGLVLKAAPAAPLADGAQTQPGDFYVEPSTLHSLGFEWNIAGDTNRNGCVKVAYRKMGEPVWREGMDLLRIDREIVFGLKSFKDEATYVCGNLYAGSILFLEPATAYQVRLTLQDPDQAAPDHVVAEKYLDVATKTPPVMWAGGRRLHVYPAGFAGVREQPAFETLNQAGKAATPGDRILLHAGEYAGPFMFRNSGTRERPVVICAAGDGPVVISGGSPVFSMAPGNYHWIHGLTFRAERVAIRCTQPTVGLTVTRCRFEGIQYCGVQTDHQSRDAYIADNEFIGTEGTWHDRDKERPYKAVWIGGQGMDVCYNRVRNEWDGLSVCGGGVPPLDDFDKKLSSIDFYNNDVAQIVDDNEADAGQHNIRFFNNRFADTYVGLSAQPVYGGPCYFVRNLQYNVKSGKVFKLNIWPAGVLIYNNTTVSGCREREPGVAYLNRGYWNTHVKNNVFLGLAGDIMTGGPRDPGVSTMDYNGYLAGSGVVRWFFFDEAEQRQALRDSAKTALPMPVMEKFPTLAGFAKATGYEQHAVSLGFDDFIAVPLPPVAPANSDPAAVDARPAAGSRAVDAGCVIPNITDGYAGAAPDMGAFEQGQPLPHYGPRD